MRQVIIVESPNKAKTIRQILGRDFEIVATVGHFRDLPEKDLGVNVEEHFEPSYVYDPNKKEVVEKLKALKGKYPPEAIFIASDADREGEAIGWHIAQTIGIESEQAQRLEFHEITPEGIKRAMESLRPLDMNLVFAQQARRILDRLVGYKVSPLIQRRLPGEKRLSAGRVQSVALMIVVDRENAIRDFVPEESWSVHAKYVEGFEAEYIGVLEGGKTPKKKPLTREEAEVLAQSLLIVPHEITKLKGKQTKRNPQAPLITSTMLQQASSQLKMGTDETTSHAKTLFEAGLITYIRTDAPSVSPEFQAETLKFLKEKYGADIVPSKPNIYKAKTDNAQEAHECIRPTRLDQTLPANLDNGSKRLYDLITKAYLASQCNPAVYDSTEVWIEAESHVLKATGRILKKKGYLAILDDRDSKETTLPALKETQLLEVETIEPKQHWTKPPDRFTEATLIKYLEEKGIGRPSTFASMVSLILRKQFVEHIDKKHLAPTTRGEKLDGELRQGFGTVIHEGFTAKLEEDLDRIALAEEAWQDFLESFWKDFKPLLDNQSDPPCSFCGAPTRRVHSPKTERDYLCCTMGREACGFIVEVEAVQYPRCPICGSMTRRYGEGVYICIRSKHPEKTCQGRVERLEELADNPKCYRCQSPMRFVKVKDAYVCTKEDCNSWLDRTALENPKCPVCGSPTRKFPSGNGYGCVRWRKDGKESCPGIVKIQ